MLDKILSTAGPLGVLVVVVYMFLKSLKERDEAHRAWMTATLESWKQTIASIDERHLMARQDSRDAIESFTKAVVDNTRATQQLSESVRTSGVRQGER